MAQKRESVIEFSAPFANCARRCSFYRFPTRPMRNIRSHGAIPFYSWGSESIPPFTTEPRFQLSDLIAGRYDKFIRRFARAAKHWGHPFFLRFDWEMNGDWFAWGERANGNRPGQFLAAWRHVHHIFRTVGANNATWVWCPNIDPSHVWTSLRELYPGPGYVDWTCLDGYNWGSRGPGSAGARRGGWQSFNSLFRSTYNTIVNKIAPSKPMILGEVGASPFGGSRAAWITKMLQELPTSYPKIHGFLWLQTPYQRWEFSIRRGTPSASALAAAIQSPAYVSNVFCRLGTTTVAPPALPLPARPCR
jgi:hypothetical protein